MLLEIAIGIEVSLAVHRQGVLHNVSVVPDHVEVHPVVGEVGRSAREFTRRVALIVISLNHYGGAQEARHMGVQHSEAITTGANVEERVAEPVDSHSIAEKPIGIECIEPELALDEAFHRRFARGCSRSRARSLKGTGILAPRFTSEFQVDVVVTISPFESRAAGQAEVHVVLRVVVMALPSLPARVDSAVYVHHGGVALVDILGRIVEHMVVKPVGAHGFLPVARNLNAAICVAGLFDRPPSACALIRVPASGFLGGVFRKLQETAALIPAAVCKRRRHADRDLFPGGFIAGRGCSHVRSTGIVRMCAVNRIVTGKNHRPSIVVELPRKEKRLGEAVAFRRVVAVVVMGRYEMVSESTIGLKLDGQRIVVPKENTFGITRDHELRRKGSIEGSKCLMVLAREERVEFSLNSGGGSVKGPATRFRCGLPRAHLVEGVAHQGVRHGETGRLVFSVGGRSARGPPARVGGDAVNYVVVKAARSEFAVGIEVHLVVIPEPAIGPNSRLGRLGIDLGKELIPPLVTKLGSGRSPVANGGVGVARDQGFHGTGVLVDDGLLPGIGIVLVGVFGGKRIEGLVKRGIECLVIRAAVSAEGAPLRYASLCGLGKRGAVTVAILVAVLGAVVVLVLRRQGFASELLEAQHMLGERQGSEKWATGRVRGNIATPTHRFAAERTR